MITSHVFRPWVKGWKGQGKTGLCAYMTCLRPRAEHARAASGVKDTRSGR